MLRAKLSEADFRLFPSAPLFVPASLMRSKHTIRKAGAVVLARCGPTFLTLTLLARMLLLADSKRKDLKSMDSSAPEGESPVDTCVYGPRNVTL